MSRAVLKQTAKKIMKKSNGLSQLLNRTANRKEDLLMSTYTMPDDQGRYGSFGGRYVPELLMPALIELEKAYHKAQNDPEFVKELDYYLTEYVGRETPLTYAENLTKHLGGPEIYLKREDLTHTGAHKINNTIGQALLTLRMGKK